MRPDHTITVYILKADRETVMFTKAKFIYFTPLYLTPFKSVAKLTKVLLLERFPIAWSKNEKKKSDLCG